MHLADEKEAAKQSHDDPKTVNPDNTLLPTDVNKVLTNSPLPLSECKLLYHPVKGTSSSSVYYVVALADDVKIAARYKNMTLSLRAEGNVGDHKSALEHAGFGLSNLNKGYVSVHLQCSDKVLAAKTLGAVLVATDLDFLTKMPQLSVFD